MTGHFTNLFFLFKRVVNKARVQLSRIGRYKKKDNNYWESLRNQYSGQRGFIIGNGPSLRVEDLDSLQGEITIASNKIYMIFPKTPWRPTFYTIADTILWPKINGEVEDKFSIIHIPD